MENVANLEQFNVSTRRVSEGKPRAAAADRSFSAWATLRYAHAEKERSAAGGGARLAFTD